MAATKYQVLYRYMNSTMDVPITNDPNTAYEPTLEFYVDPDHRIFSTDNFIQVEETEKQQQMIVEANSSDNPKNDMLFIYNGTARIPHPKWIEEEGYIVRDYQLLLRSDIGDRGDFTKLFTTLDKATCEDGGIVVCSPRNMTRAAKKYPFTIHFNDQAHKNGRHGKHVTTSKQLQEDFINSSVFKLKDEDWMAHTSPSNYVRTASQGNVHYCTGPVFVDCTPTRNQVRVYSSTYYVTDYGLYDDYLYSDKVFGDVFRTIKDIETVDIPGHYEDVIDSPYLIKDVYKRIENSPWIINCTVGSLDAALEKAKKLIEMIGIENVKIIKVVPFDQFIKIN